MKKCPKCNSKYEDNNSYYCINCGSKLIDLKSPKGRKRAFHKTGDYRIDLKIAEEIYKIYDENGVARFDNVNGRLLASQTRKIDILIEQNNRIINLLERIANKS